MMVAREGAPAGTNLGFFSCMRLFGGAEAPSPIRRKWHIVCRPHKLVVAMRANIPVSCARDWDR